MEPGSPTLTLASRLRKRSISSHPHSKPDGDGRTLIKTKIQKIDGQYRASPTCPINNNQDQQHESDDQDEPLIVATFPPLVQDSSNYRTRQDTYDDETGDDQQSNSSSIDYSPTRELEPPLPILSPVRPAHTIHIEKPTQILNNNGNETINETSVEIPTVSTKNPTNLLSEENVSEKPVVTEELVIERTKPTKKSNTNKTSLSHSSSAISIELNQTK